MRDSSTVFALSRQAAALIAIVSLAAALTCCSDAPVTDEEVLLSDVVVDALSDLGDSTQDSDSAADVDGQGDGWADTFTVDAPDGVLANCGANTCATDEVCCDGACVDLLSDATSCGACGLACAGGESCEAGQCTCGSVLCSPQQRCCGAAPQKLCLDVQFDDRNCGGCGVVCDQVEVCVQASCACIAAQGTLEVCGDTATCCPGAGCFDFDTDPLNCGGCGLECGSGELCDQGVCSCGAVQGSPQACGATQACCGEPATCQPAAACLCGSVACGAGQSCCDTDVGGGNSIPSCVSTYRDEANCGGCGQVCGSAESCVGGACACQSGFADCDGDAASGCEVALDSDPAHCGACGNACPPQSVCDGAGQCALACQVGYTNCAGHCVDLESHQADCGACAQSCGQGEVCDGEGECETSCLLGLTDCTGDCVDTLWNRGHCGTCGNACGPGLVCDGVGDCALTCQPGLVNCGGNCVQLDTNRRHCGVCGHACVPGEVCDGTGTCAVECQPGLTSCGGSCRDTVNDRFNCGGCFQRCGVGEYCDGGVCAKQCPANRVQCGDICINPSTDPEHCGACDQACASDELCIAGTCVFVCSGGRVDCGGTCIDTRSDASNCGGCGVTCADDAFCQAGQCTPRCAGWLEYCDGVCVDTTKNTAHCGACSAPCATAELCQSGACTSGCPSGFARCAGACVNTDASPVHCGACGQPCGANEQCLAGVCTSTCPSGYESCGGACLNVTSDPTHCGGCTTSCGPGEICQTGACVSGCPVGTENCTGNCVDTAVNPAHCGGCGVLCAAGEACQAGACASTCAASFSNCAGACIDTESSNAHCGGCGLACPSGKSCVGGTCACPGGLNDCSGACVNFAASMTNCGGCGVICDAATETCSGGLCVSTVSQCPPGRTFCDPLCVDITADDQHCGGCDLPCGALQDCVSGACVCSLGYGDCNGLSADGCEVQTFYDVAHCGACGNACGANAFCFGGVCDCTSAWGDCDAAPGCETGIGNDANNCGACGNICVAGTACFGGLCVPDPRSRVDAGWALSCGVKIDGSAYCWGKNDWGQLGDGSRDSSGGPHTAVRVAGFDGASGIAKAISAGATHGCAIDDQDTAWCWGLGTAGQLGDGQGATSYTPRSVMDATGAVALANVVDIGAGEYWFTCAVTADGRAYCWGNNAYLALGTGGGSVDLPTQVTGIDGVSLSATKIAAGSQHACAVVDGGQVRCWGENTYGQLGDGSITDRSTPVTTLRAASVPLDGAVDVCASRDISCALASTGKVFCWGYNRSGAVGNGTTLSTTPVTYANQVVNIDTATDIACGNTFACALLADGSTRCWGDDISQPPGTRSGVPYQVVGLDSAIAVSGGGTHACYVDAADVFRCWGGNGYGEVGVPSIGGKTDTPTLAYGLTDVVEVETGLYHTCARTAAAGVYCWGWGDGARTGLGNMNTTGMPTAVPGSLGAVGLSVATSSMLRKADGSVLSWGNNSFYRTGLAQPLGYNALVPEPHATLDGVTASAVALGAGNMHGCAVRDDGTVSCWGNNGVGQLGNGTWTASQTPVQVLEYDGVTKVAAAMWSSLGMHTCALDVGNAPECWGANTAGQLGNNSLTSQNSPTPVQNLATVDKIKPGWVSTCAISGGAAYCWGDGALGALGTGSATNRLIPTQVVGIDGVSLVATDIAPGAAHGCAAINDGTARCWGDNGAGQLGVDATTTTSSLVPVVVPNLAGVVAVNAGYQHSCAIVDTGELYCWGSDFYGQLGRGALNQASEPVRVIGVP